MNDNATNLKPLRKSILSRFSSSAFCVLVSRMLAFVAVFGFNAVLARALVPAEFGLFALLYSLAMLTCLVASLGMNRALVMVLADERYPRDRNHVRQLLILGTWVSILGGIFAAVVSWFGVMVFLPELETGSRFTVACLFAVIVLLRNLHFVLAETTRGFHETNWSNLFGGSAGGPLPHMIFLVALLVYGVTDLTEVLGVYLVCFLITLPPLAFKLFSLDFPSGEPVPRRSPATESSSMSLPNIWALAIPIMLTQAFGLTISQADIWLAGALLLPASIAIYCSAQRLLAFLTLPLQISGTAMISFVPELMSRDAKKELQEIVGLATFVSAIPTIAIAVFLILFPVTVLTLIYGEFYAAGALVLQVLVVGQLVCVLAGPCEMVLMMAGHQKKTLYVNVASAICIGTLGPLAISCYGITGLALAMGAVTIGQNVFNVWLVQRLVGIDTRFSFSYFHALRMKCTEQILSLKRSSNVSV
jgi:O-antigen/teichoic acid export membrane protein